MKLINVLENVEHKDDFIKFVYSLVEDLKHNPAEWENTTLADFLNSVASWVEDTEAETVDWNLIATILFAGSRYE